MRGAASALLDAASQRARDCGCEAVTVGYAASPEEEEALHAFFLRRGFSLPQEETTVFTLPVRSLADTRLASLPEPSGADASEEAVGAELSVFSEESAAELPAQPAILTAIVSA